MNLGKVDILARVGKNGTNDPVIPVELGIGHLHSFVQYDTGQSRLGQTAKRLRQLGRINAVEANLVSDVGRFQGQGVAIVDISDHALQQTAPYIDPAQGGVLASGRVA